MLEKVNGPKRYEREGTTAGFNTLTKSKTNTINYNLDNNKNNNQDIYSRGNSITNQLDEKDRNKLEYGQFR